MGFSVVSGSRFAIFVRAGQKLVRGWRCYLPSDTRVIFPPGFVLCGRWRALEHLPTVGRDDPLFIIMIVIIVIVYYYLGMI